MKGIHIDDSLIDDVNRIIEEFLYDGGEEIDYADLERRLKN